VDHTIRQQQEHVVNRLALGFHNMIPEPLQDGAEVSRATQLDVRKCTSVSVKDSHDALDFRLGFITINWEAVARNLVWHVSSKAAEAIHGEHLIGIVVFNDRTHLGDSSFVLVAWTHKVETAGVTRHLVRTSVVDRDELTNLPA